MKKRLPVRYEAIEIRRRFSGLREVQGVAFSAKLVRERLTVLGYEWPSPDATWTTRYFHRPRRDGVRLRVLHGDNAVLVTPQLIDVPGADFRLPLSFSENGWTKLPRLLSWMMGGADLHVRYGDPEKGDDWQITVSVDQGRSLALRVDAAPRKASLVRGFRVLPASRHFPILLSMLRDEMPFEAFVDWVSDTFQGLVPNAPVSGVRLGAAIGVERLL